MNALDKVLAVVAPSAIAKRILAAGALAVAVTAILTVVGLINKLVIADPITKAMVEERKSREAGDKAIIEKLADIKVGQDQVIEAVELATYSKGTIDKMRRDADAVHRDLQTEDERIRARLDRQDFRLERIEGRLKMPTQGSRPAPAIGGK